MKGKKLVLNIGLFSAFCIVTANRVIGQKDVLGSKDHPVVSRFNDSYIRFYSFNKFDIYNLRGGPIQKSQEKWKQDKLEGAVTRIVYQSPKTVAAFEMYKSYEIALIENGFKKLYSCESGGCGNGFGLSYPSDNAPHIRSYDKDQRYFSGKRRENDSTEIYVALYSVFTQDGPVVRLDVIEVKSMEEGQVKVSAAQLKSEFEKLGKAVINSIYFESGKAVLLPGSIPALDEIAIFLKQNAELNVFVVGHTDSDGGYSLNMSLSKLRAEAVVKELVGKYGIPATRLKAEGVGYLCPVSGNTTASGKAKNRRVELVSQ